MNNLSNNSFFQELTAISPLDGRYKKRLDELTKFVSEYSLIKTRVEVEVKYLIALSQQKVVRHLNSKEIKFLSSLYDSFSLKKAAEIKMIEKETRHDVKAVEKFLRNTLKNTSLKDCIEMLHFGLTSEDVNNISYRILLRGGTSYMLIPALEKIIDWLARMADQYKSLPMLARTHGQPAVPTTLGKELVVFASRLHKEFQELKQKKLTSKLNGAVGNFNALFFVYPHVDWIQFSDKFIASLDLTPNLTTTQINTYEDIVSYCHAIHRINSILIDFNQDMWRYISDNWFIQEVKKGEVGSSTMPQKVNPIDFENSEGNLGMANAIINYFAGKFPVSRLQRDLSDSTTIRNIGSLLGYCLIGYTSIITGLSRIKPNQTQIKNDLTKDWSILSEGVQTFLRKKGIDDPYTLLSSSTRGERIDKDTWLEWLKRLDIAPADKKALQSLTPETYIGLAADITEKAIRAIRAAKKR